MRRIGVLVVGGLLMLGCQGGGKPAATASADAPPGEPGGFTVDGAVQADGAPGAALDGNAPPADAGPDALVSRAADGAIDVPTAAPPDAAGDLAPAAMGGDAAGDTSPAPDAGATPPGDARRPFCGAEGFCWVHPTPQGNPLRAIWGSGRNDVWAVGDRGTVIHWNGQSFEDRSPGSLRDLRGIWGSGPNDVFVAGDGRELQRWDGRAWQPLRNPGVLNGHHGLSGTASDDVWVNGGWEELFHWNGVQFAGAFHAGYELRPQASWSYERHRAFVVGYPGVIANARYNPAMDFTGASMEYMAPPAPPGSLSLVLLGVWAASAIDAWVVGERGTILHRDRLRWTPVTSGVMVDLHAVWGASADDVWAVGKGGTILRWRGAAQGWVAADSPTRLDLHAIWGSAADDVWAAGDGGVIVRFDGQRWTSPFRITEADLEAVWALSPDDAWVVGAAGTVLRWQGAGFTKVPSPVPNDLTDVWAAGSSSVWMVGGGGMILEWDGGKLIPTLLPNPTNLESIWGLGPTDIWAVGGVIHHFDGRAWTRVTQPANTGASGVWTNDPARLWVLARYDTLMIYQRATAQWQTHKAPAEYALWGSSATDIHVVGVNGHAGRFDGQSWTSGAFLGSSAHAVWGTSAGEVWAAGSIGLIARRPPGGQWERSPSQQQRMTSNDLSGVRGSGPGDIWMVGEDGSILRRR